MSILINGMEMPTRCEDCPCFYPEYNECNALVGRWVGGKATPPSDCPLVHVPPHGDLIDRKELLKHDHQHYEYLSDEFYITVRDIESAPTIIEANEGAEGESE